MDAGYTPPIAAGIRPLYLRARDRGYIRGYGWHAEVRKILVIQIVSVCYSTPAGGATESSACAVQIGSEGKTSNGCRSRLRAATASRAISGSDAPAPEAHRT